MTFDDLIFNRHSGPYSGHAKAHFPNGYSASVVQFDDGDYELAVLMNGKLIYNTPITDDVLGDLTEDDVTRLRGEIEALPKPGDPDQ